MLVRKQMKVKSYLNTEITEIKNIKEYSDALTHLEEGKYNEAELKLKECLSFLKHSNSTETLGYNHILRK